jgi:hypothetical protein
MPLLDISDVFGTVEYQPENFLLEFIRHFEIPVHLAAFALQPIVMWIKTSMKKKTLLIWCRTGEVQVRYEFKGIFVLPKRACGNTACRVHVSIQRKASATSQMLRFCSQAGILQVAEWQSPVASLHALYRRSAIQSRWRNTHNSNVRADENPHATVERRFQLGFSVSVWCAVLHDKLIGSFILESRFPREAHLRFLQEELHRLLVNVPLNKRGCM